MMLAAAFGVGCSKAKGPSTTLPIVELRPAFRRVRRRIRKHVEDRRRRERALALVDEASRTLARLGVLLVQWREATALLPDEQRRDRTKVLAITDAYCGEIGWVVHQAAAIAIALRDEVTEAEWSLVFPAVAGDAETPC